MESAAWLFLNKLKGGNVSESWREERRVEFVVLEHRENSFLLPKRVLEVMSEYLSEYLTVFLQRLNSDDRIKRKV